MPKASSARGKARAKASERTEVALAAIGVGKKQVARTRAKWPLWVALLAMGAGVTILALLTQDDGRDADSGQRDPGASARVGQSEPRADSALDARLRLADRYFKDGHIAEPVGGNALEILVAARNQHPDHPEVVRRLQRIADHYQGLADAAVQRESFTEAVRYLRVVVTADPSRASAAKRMSEIEESLLGTKKKSRE